jgi:hypothetical protein
VLISPVSVFEDGAIVSWVNPDAIKDGCSKRGVGGAEVFEGSVGLGSSENTGEIKDSGGIISATDSNDSSGSEGRLREHAVVQWGRSAGGTKGADVDECALKTAI